MNWPAVFRPPSFLRPSTDCESASVLRLSPPAVWTSIYGANPTPLTSPGREY